MESRLIFLHHRVLYTDGGTWKGRPRHYWICRRDRRGKALENPGFHSNLKESGEVILRENELVDPMPPRKASKVRAGDRTANRHR